MKINKHLSAKEKIQRNMFFASLGAVTVILLTRNDFRAVILFWVGIISGAILSLNYLKK